MKIDQRKFWPEVLPGWKMKLDEVSNNHYQIIISDDYGRQAATYGDDPEIIATCEQYVLDIERQISKDINGFLLGCFIIKLNKASKEHRVDDWIINTENGRLVFDLKDNMLYLEKRNNEAWHIESNISIAQITINNINSLVELC